MKEKQKDRDNILSGEAENQIKENIESDDRYYLESDGDMLECVDCLEQFKKPFALLRHM